ncbi:MAG TPA: DEAD/DEAH box helicase [Allocoleopsis sp.]
MKAIISNRIYLNRPPEGWDNIKKALTYRIEHKPIGPNKTMGLEFIRNYKHLPKDILSIPQGRVDLIPQGYEIIDKRTYNELPLPEPLLPLREDQKTIIDKINDSCFLNALVGWGKTFAALHLAKKLGQKTLIVTHTTILRDQWREEIEKLYRMPVGIIGSGSYDIDHTLVVGNVQTLTKYSTELGKEFGTIILDEAHHCPASTFTNIIDASYARYRIGLSGTMLRKDGKHILFRDYFGSTVLQPEQANTIDPVIKVVKSGISLRAGEPWTKKINILLYDPDYQSYIAAIASAQKQLGHVTLIIADRVEFLTNIKEMLGETCVLVTGSTSLEERKQIAEQIESGEKTIIAGSRQIFSEGISINKLSCVILATPISGEALLEQIIGRIMRQHPNKKSPEVVDIQFSGSADRAQNNARIGLYMKKGWKIKTI